jgi:hypothetical protein
MANMDNILKATINIKLNLNLNLIPITIKQVSKQNHRLTRDQSATLEIKLYILMKKIQLYPEVTMIKLHYKHHKRIFNMDIPQLMIITIIMLLNLMEGLMKLILIIKHTIAITKTNRVISINQTSRRKDNILQMLNNIFRMLAKYLWLMLIQFNIQLLKLMFLVS